MSISKKPFVIVVGLDYSEHSDAALGRAFELASGEAGELHVVSVLPPLNLDQPSVPKGTLLDVEVAAAKLHRYVASQWNAFWRSPQGQWLRPPKRVVSHVRFDRPANGIVQLAADLSADLVVVGTHGRQGLTRFLLGSVSEQVLRLAACPVLVMRPKAPITEDPVIEAACASCQQQREQSASELWCAEHQSKRERSHIHYAHDRPAAGTSSP
ncbi:MAG TPA: universal stress protein [Polyangiaceae bacterium]|jgi:nucleotide-binding universal stress UspA family protein